MNPSDQPSATDTIEAKAAEWLARRDRGLTATEQDAYLQWLREDPRHGAAIARLGKVWGVLDQLSEWRPQHSPQPNPDLLAPKKRRGRIYWWTAAAGAMAAVFALLLFANARPTPGPAHRQAIIHPGPERMALDDGSVIELNTGAKVDVQFTSGERRVKLLAGEAHFTVAHNTGRPFFVDTGKVSVRAVGTAFSVALGSQDVAVLVTEGKVQVLAQGADGARSSALSPQPPVFLTAGQQATIGLAPAAAVAPVVQDVTPAEVERSLAWQAMRLEFVDMPLGDVVAEFNRYNRRKLVIADDATAAILVGGNFRADNVDTFVRLLGTGFGVTAFPHGDEIVLRKVP